MTTDQRQAYRSVWTELCPYGFEQGFIDAGGIRTRYAHAGDSNNPPLLLLHGTGGHWEAYCANVGPLSRHFNCYAFDFVGSGMSDKPDRPYEIADYIDHTRAFMAAVGFERASMVGISLGAWVASAFALKHPQSLDKLILISAAGYFSNAETREQIKKDRGGGAADPSWDKIRGIFDRLIAREENRIDDLIGLRQKIYKTFGAAAAMKNVLALQDPETRARNLIPDEEWARIKAPTLIVGSLSDAEEYLETSRRVTKLIPNSRYVEIEGVAHWAQFESPQVFNEQAIAFLKG